MRMRRPCIREYAVKLLFSEIIYDVNFATWKRASQLDTGEKEKNKKELSEQEQFFILRQVETAIANILSTFSWCTKHHYHYQSDEIREAPKDWDIIFRFSDEWRGNIRTIKDYLHKYVVEYILCEWYRLTDPASSAEALSLAEDWLHKALMEARSVKLKDVRFIL